MSDSVVTITNTDKDSLFKFDAGEGSRERYWQSLFKEGADPFLKDSNGKCGFEYADSMQFMGSMTLFNLYKEHLEREFWKNEAKYEAGQTERLDLFCSFKQSLERKFATYEMNKRRS